MAARRLLRIGHPATRFPSYSDNPVSATPSGPIIPYTRVDRVVVYPPGSTHTISADVTRSMCAFPESISPVFAGHQEDGLL